MYGLDDMYLFKSVVDYGGVSAAARKLGLSKSTTARRIAELEKRLDAHLYHRSSRRFLLTNLGAECYEACARLAVEADKLLEISERSRRVPAGFLHVICPPVLGSMLIELLAVEFASAAPDVRLHLEETTGILDPRTAQADLVIYPAFKPLPDSTVVVRKLFSSPYILVAHPDLFRETPAPADPNDMRSMRCLGLGARDAEWVWNLNRGRESVRFRFEPFFTTTLPSALLQAARQGLGIASLPTVMCAADLASGKLVRVLDDWNPDPVNILALYPSNRTLTVAARTFLDILIERLPLIANHVPDLPGG